MSVRLIFETTDTDGDSVIIETRCGKPDELIVWGEATYLTRQRVTELHTAIGEWLASTAPEASETALCGCSACVVTRNQPAATDRDVERDAQVAELARVVAGLGQALTHIHGRIDSLAARVNQLEADAAKPSPLHQAIADEIRRAAGAR